MRKNALLKARNSIQALLKHHGGYLTLPNQRRCQVPLGASYYGSNNLKQPLLTPSLPTLNREGGSWKDPEHGSTIYALSTAPGRAGIAIIRISGPSCLDV